MGKIEVKPNTKQNQILKIWYGEEEPPKKYIWANPDGFYYVWENDYWAAYDDLTEIKIKPEMCCNGDDDKDCPGNVVTCMPCSCMDYITPEKLTDRLEKFQRDILKYVIKMIREKSNGASDETVSALIRDLQSRLTALENGASINLDGYATEQWVLDKNYLVSVDLNGYASQNWVQNQHYLTQHQDISNLATKEYVDSKALDSEEFDALATQLGYIKDSALTVLRNKVSSLEDTVSGLLSTIASLTNRIAALEAIDHSEFVTTGNGNNSNDVSQYVTWDDMDDYVTNQDLQNVLNEFATYDDTALAGRVTALENTSATQTWVNTNFEPKFTDLTSEQDPVAVAETHTNDNRVYITEVEEGEQPIAL